MERSVIINIRFKDQHIDTYVVAKPTVVIGRDPAADICLDNPGVSRQHATIEISDGLLLLRDLSSANGTLVNGELATRCELGDGDTVRIGRFELQILVPHVVDGRNRASTKFQPPPGATIEAPSRADRTRDA